MNCQRNILAATLLVTCMWAAFSSEPRSEARLSNQPATAMQSLEKFTVEIYMTESSYLVESVTWPQVQQVRNDLRAPLLGVERASVAIETIRGELDRIYYGAYEEEELHFHYAIVWCPDIGDYKVICNEIVEFRILLAGGSVTVRVEEILFLE